MTFLPIVGRELRVTARRRATYWSRSLLAFLAIAVGVGTFFTYADVEQSEAGPLIFRWLAGLLLLYCLFYGARSTADCLSSEKRDGTLGLLFLTDLKGYDVVLGKMAATSLNGFYGLLAVFPVLAVPLLMGGTTQGEFWRMVLVLMNTFLFSLAVGIFASAICREARVVASLNFLLVVLPTVLLPGVAALIMSETNGREFHRWLLLASPGYPFVLSFDMIYTREAEFFWWSNAVIHASTWILALLASLIVPRTWQDRPVRQATGRSFRDFWRQRRYGHPALRVALRRRLLRINAFFWLASRDRRKPVRVWIFLLLMGIWWLWGWTKFGNDWFDPPICLLTAFLLNTALKLWVALETGERLVEDRASGALELLLSTPLTIREVLRGQRLALLRQFLGPGLLVFVVEFVLMLVSFEHDRSDNPGFLLAAWPAGLSMLALDVVAVYWAGMYAALTVRNPRQAASTTVVRVLALPWVGFGAVQAAVGFGMWMQWFSEPGWQFYLSVWFAFGVLVDCSFGFHARRKLLTRFRELPLRLLLRPARARVANA